MTWKSRSLSTLVLKGIDQPSVETALYALPPSKTAGGAAKANLSKSLVFFCWTRSFIRPENMIADGGLAVVELLLHLGLVEGRHLRVHVGQQRLHLLERLAVGSGV